MNLSTGTMVSQLPTGSVIFGNDVFPFTHGITGSAVPQAQQASFLLLQQSMANSYAIVPSVSGGVLTIMISGTFPVNFNIGDTNYTLPAPVSFTSPTGTNWCNSGGSELATNAVDYFMYAIGETGASAGLKFGYSRISYARTMSDFTNTNTNEKYIKGNWTNFNNTDSVRNIGRFRATLSASPYVWSISSSVVVNYPIFETSWLTWTPVYAGWSANPTTQNTNYKLDYDLCNVTYILAANGTSNATSGTFTVPFQSPVSTPLLIWTAVTDNGSLQSAQGHVQSYINSNQFWAWKTFYQGAWTNTGAKGINMPQFVFRIR